MRPNRLSFDRMAILDWPVRDKSRTLLSMRRKSGDIWGFGGWAAWAAVMALVVGLGTSGCGSSGSTTNAEPSGPDESGPDPVPDPDPDPPAEPGCVQSFDSTYEAVQELVFERHGCTAVACHGSGGSGGLVLTAEVSYENLFQVDSQGSGLLRVSPGMKDSSYLWAKVDASDNEASLAIAGTMMPPSGQGIGEVEKELLRSWIQAGAQREGTVVGTAELLDACLPDPVPLEIEPLEAPGVTEGVQFVMPAYKLEKASEKEVCFATYVDFCEQIPDEFKTEDGKFFYYDSFEIRQDPASHHLLVMAPSATLSTGDAIDPLELSDWKCMGGENEGDLCDPLDEQGCSRGACATPVLGTTACIGYAPGNGVRTNTFAGTQQPQFRSQGFPGVFRRAPCATAVFWNSHSFNLTQSDTKMHARLNFEFATDRRYRSRGMSTHGGDFGIVRLQAEGAAPYTEEVMCDTVTVPRGAHVTGFSSHVHKHGKHSWWELPGGTHIYDSYIYNDPLQLRFDEPMIFDGEDDASRTLTFCSLYNNGVDADGNPDPETVTRASRVLYGVGGPGSLTLGMCEPTQCVNPGSFTVRCDDGIRNQAGDDAACDTAPGAGDGNCDACSITGGVTTENEMFSGSLGYFMVD